MWWRGGCTVRRPTSALVARSAPIPPTCCTASRALRAIFRAFHAANPAALTVTVEQPHLANYSLHAPHDRGSDEIIDAYNRRLRAVAGRHGVVLASVTGWNPGTMLSADTVHPNDAGHAQVADAVVRAVQMRGPW
jgi:lysophospholipase L1-like esterase